jgi:hypothetical protein
VLDAGSGRAASFASGRRSSATKGKDPRALVVTRRPRLRTESPCMSRPRRQRYRARTQDRIAAADNRATELRRARRAVVERKPGRDEIAMRQVRRGLLQRAVALRALRP